MNIAQRYYHWRKTQGKYRRIDLANDLTVNLRTVERWLSGATKRPPVKRFEAAIARAERRLKTKMPRESRN